MSKPLIVEPEAEADLRAAYQWYEQQRPGLGIDLILCVEAALQAIRDRPRSFPIVRKKTRRVLLRRFPYMVLFIELKDTIVVLGIFHGRRNPQSWRERSR